MGKKKGGNELGRSLIKDRFGSTKGRKFVDGNSMLHTTEIQDGYDWGRLNLQSVTEESSFQEFLSTAELAGTEFQAAKLNIKFVNPRANVGLLSKEEKRQAESEHQKNKELLKIPRRPQWTTETTLEELEINEKEHFLEWRRNLSKLQEEQGLLITPYEKNLEFWRQLWRVVERSDVIVQIVDARNPLLFRCEDLERYVTEVNPDKLNLILVNKADFLNDDQRQNWAAYFDSEKIHVAFFSAVLAAEKQNTAVLEENDTVSEIVDIDDDIDKIITEMRQLESAVEESAENLFKISERVNNFIKQMEEPSAKSLNNDVSDAELCSEIQNTSKLLTREDLIELFRTIHKRPKVLSDVTTIGLVGYPNVGKSSTINALMTTKKVSVSATPGKTKHFQTLFLDKDILLCDCPGLVMPTFVFTKAEMIVNGILPIDQMRDHVPPVNLVCSLIPRHVVEDRYGIMLPEPVEGEDQDRPPFAEELLNSYAYNRGFMTANGQPDNPRAARYILKDFVNGKLLYAHAPPSVRQSDYHSWPERQKIASINRIPPPRAVRAVKPHKITSGDIDKIFFKSASHGVHVKGVFGKSSGYPNSGRSESEAGSVQSLLGEKPWKKINRHENKNKREKLRRVYAYLDQH